MKKNIVMMVIAFSISMQAMENPSYWSITLHGTKINLTKGFIGDAGDRVDCIVLGRQQQRTLQEPSLGDLNEIGKMNFQDCIYRKSKEDESASDDDTYKPYEQADYSSKDEKTKIWKRTIAIEVNTDVVTIIEPRIMKTSSYDSEYNTIEVPYYVNQKSCWDGAKGVKAIEEAEKDLKMCYEKILGRLAEHVRDKNEKNIALQALGTEVGFPREKAAPIAVKTVVEFIQNHPGVYTAIELFVKKHSEFKLYQELLTQSATEK